MNNEDQLFREALQRQNDRAAERLTLPDDFADRVAQRIGQRPKRRHTWLYAAIAAAASVAILLIEAPKAPEVKAPPSAPEVKAPPSAPEGATIAHPHLTARKTIVAHPRLSTRKAIVAPSGAEGGALGASRASRASGASLASTLPDTLGNGIWQSEENVVRALQMLADCEATIASQDQEVYNAMVKAVFNATPQSADAILVSNEAGDYEVINRQATIDI